MRGPRYKFDVLFLCTANLCRSPMAEMLLRAQLESRLGQRSTAWHVGSAGLAAHTGPDMDPMARQTLLDRGIEPAPFQRRAVTGELLERADLILTAQVSHRSAAIRMVPTVAGNTFTIKQFAGLCRDLPLLTFATPAEAGRALLAAALLERGRNPVVAPSRLDLDDPYGQGWRKFRKCADTLEAAISMILAPIFPDPPGAGR